MAKSIKLRQGTADEHAAFTGAMAEVTFDTTNNTVVLHDGVTVGGIPMAKLSDVPVDLTDLTDVDDNLNVVTDAVTDATYDFSNTTLAYTLDNPNPFGTSADDVFGMAVAISGDHAIVGTDREDDSGGTSSGKAYIYNVTTGTLVHTLDNPNAYGTSDGDQFGLSVAISGDHAIIGAYNEDDSGSGGNGSGKAYIYNVTTGTLVHTLDNPSAYGTSEGDNFGFSVSISGDHAIVGAYGEDDVDGITSGKAYIYNVSTGALVHTLDNPNAYGTSGGDLFGMAVAISGDRAIIGALGEDEAGTYSGKAYIYNVTTGALVHTLDNPNPYSSGTDDYFSSKVAISGDHAIVGANGEDEADGGGAGKAYIYNVTTGALVHTLDNPNPYGSSANDQFGMVVAISGDYAIVPAVSEDELTGYNSGKAYIYNVTSGALVKTLDNPNAYDTPISDGFGRSIAISDGRVIVGARDEDDAGGTSSGKAYIFNAP